MRALANTVTGGRGRGEASSLEGAKASRLEATLTRRKVVIRPGETHRVLPSGFGYVRFGQWSLSLTRRAIEALEELKDAPGLVIDLRGNPGGAVQAVNQMLERFFPPPTELGHTPTRTGKPTALFMGPLPVEIIQLKRHLEGRADASQGRGVVLAKSG